MESKNRVFDDLARLANGALSAAAGARQEMEQLLTQRFERFLNERGWVTREEFEGVRDLAQKARHEQEVMEKRITLLEKKLFKDADDNQARKVVKARRASRKNPPK